MARPEWKVTPVNKSSVKRLEYGLSVSAAAAAVLVARGLAKEADARTFIEPALANLRDALRLPDIGPAIGRLIDAVGNDEHIMVLGHDDVDGITATTITFGALKEIGADVSYYIPDSPTEGIGLSKRLVERFKKSGVSLVITVDCGVSCRDEVAYAKTLGIDTVITDHHEPPRDLPPAIAVVNAKRRDSEYGFRDLAGCGVALRFMEAFAEEYRKVGSPPSREGSLGMASLGSVSDRVPLVDENRVIAYHGVRDLLNKRIVPFVALRSHIWIDQESMMTEVFLKMIPILGASRSHEGGNLGCELLLATDQDDAEEIFGQLIMESERKKERSRRALERVRDHLAKTDSETFKSVVLVEEHLPNKTVGYCTSKVAEDLHKAVVIISMRGDTGIGEARGPKGIDLVEALDANKQFLIGFGGHKQAAGFSIERSKVDAFKAGFIDFLEAKIDPSLVRREITIDSRLGVEDLDAGSLKSLLCLEPFGEENQRPVFLLENIDAGMLKEVDGTWRLKDVSLVGNGLPADMPRDPDGKLSLVVSPFADGSIRAVEVIDWRRTR